MGFGTSKKAQPITPDTKAAAEKRGWAKHVKQVQQSSKANNKSNKGK